MPIYEYKCADCGGVFEVMVSRSRRRRHPPCDQCGGSSTERVMSSFSGRSHSDGGGKRLGGSACANCSATSCATCKR